MWLIPKENTHSAPETVPVTNITDTPFVIKTINYTGDIHFTNCPDSLAPGGSCSLFVTFTPTALGTRTGTITIRDTSQRHQPGDYSFHGYGNQLT